MPEALYTIGHSNHSLEHFLELLRQHAITALGDVRSSPHSRMNPQFNREELQRALKAAGIAYVFLGKELGGRSEDPACYDGGRLQYDRLAQTERYRQGLDRVREEMRGSRVVQRVALMCAEKEPLDCHRALLIARSLEASDLAVLHIHADGRLERHAEAVVRLLRQHRLPDFELFRTQEEIIAEAYRRQQDRIAFERQGALDPETLAWRTDSGRSVSG